MSKINKIGNKLDLGCGDNPKEGYIGIEAFRTKQKRARFTR